MAVSLPVLGKDTEVKDEHSQNAPYSIEVRDSGKVTDFKMGHEPKADIPMVVRDSGMVTEIKDKQSENAKLPMVVILHFSGKVTEVKAEHS